LFSITAGSVNIHFFKRLANGIERVYLNVGSNESRQHSILRLSIDTHQVVVCFNDMLGNAQVGYDIAGNVTFGQHNFNSILGMHEVGDSATLNEFAMLQDTNRIAKHLHLRQVVRAEKYSFTLLAQRRNKLANLPLAIWIKSVCGLIQDEQLWVTDDSPGSSPGGSERCFHASTFPL
jgi:hypothetical protein